MIAVCIVCVSFLRLKSVRRKNLTESLAGKSPCEARTRKTTGFPFPVSQHVNGRNGVQTIGDVFSHCLGFLPLRCKRNNKTAYYNRSGSSCVFTTWFARGLHGAQGPEGRTLYVTRLTHRDELKKKKKQSF